MSLEETQEFLNLNLIDTQDKIYRHLAQNSVDQMALCACEWITEVEVK